MPGKGAFEDVAAPKPLGRLLPLNFGGIAPPQKAARSDVEAIGAGAPAALSKAHRAPVEVAGQGRTAGGGTGALSDGTGDADVLTTQVMLCPVPTAGCNKWRLLLVLITAG